MRSTGLSRLAGALCLLLGVTGASAIERPVAGSDAPMRYLANATDPGLATSWTQPDFDDGAWTSGSYGVGYETGTGVESLIRTAVPIDTYSVYTRTTFDVADPTAIGNLYFGADFDDGVVVWLNGVEIWRSPEMPLGPPAWNTEAAIRESSNGFEASYEPWTDVTSVALPELVSGTNVLAVGVWNGLVPSSDLILVPQLLLDRAVSVVRGPYLQLGTPSSIIVRWRTDTAQSSRVDYGSAPGALGSSVGAPAPVNDHELVLEGLSPETRYYYAIGNDAELLVGDQPTHFFDTPPAAGTARPLRIWALGDSGTADAVARSVRDGFYRFAGTTHVDLWLMLGDNAYLDGTDAEYQAAVFEMFPSTLRSSVLWPTPGNHDVLSSDSPTESGPYFDMFSLPRAAEAGGVGSGSEAYYSFDVGNAHFVVLDSSDSVRTPAGEMYTWLQQDLQANTRDWLIAYWHHPPYSKGSHDSDLESQPIEMREHAVPLLEAHGVDLVLTGHSHSYERSFLIDGHQGDSTTFGPQHVVDGGDGREGGAGVYLKSAVGPQPNEGAVYVVAGNAGSLALAPLNHPAMYVSLSVLGSLVIDLDHDRLDVRLIGDDAAERDSFTIVKGPYCPPGTDADGDFVCDPDDNCPTLSNLGQSDSDADGLGDACDVCPTDPGNDPDADGVCAAEDTCPATSNPLQTDTDLDGLGDACDDCPDDPDNDVDLDAFCGDVDTCPAVFNPCQRDSDGDGVGDACETSSPASCNVFADRDSVLDKSRPNDSAGDDEELPSDSAIGARKWPVLGYDLSPILSGASISRATAWFHALEADLDATTDVRRVTDGWTEQNVTWANTAADVDPTPWGSFVPNNGDWVGVDVTTLIDAWNTGALLEHGLALVTTAAERTTIYASRDFADSGLRPCLDVVYECLLPGSDTDGDGTPDIFDGCPNDPAKTAPGVCGCGNVDVDSDGDDTFDCHDECPIDPLKIAPGACGCDLPDVDADLDGLADCVDACPADPDNDLDVDGVCGELDNCPSTANLGQLDADTDGAGDLCDVCPLDADDDGDSDGVCGDVDVCPLLADPAQGDADTDRVGDACDPCPADADNDFDADGICGDLDNCPGTPNTDQVDVDGDGIGDACWSVGDTDADGVPDGFDNCPLSSNPAQRDADSDAIGDACDMDDDGDGVADDDDCAPLSRAVSSTPGEIGPTLRVGKAATGTHLLWSRAPQGHVSDVYRGERPAAGSWDGLLDCVEFATPLTESVRADAPPPNGLYLYLVAAANSCGTSGIGTDSIGGRPPVVPGCPYGVADADGDGVEDRGDSCPLLADPTLSDVDGDFVGDLCDDCPTVADPAQADADGDGRGDACEGLIDEDGDGIDDALDNCPTQPNTLQQDSDADGLGDACDVCPAIADPQQADADADSAGDACDNCPGTWNPEQSDPDADGLGAACDRCPFEYDPLQEDTEADGVGDLCDNCPLIPNPDQLDTDNDELGDACDPCPVDPGVTSDLDGDGICDPVDNCPNEPNACQADLDGDGLGDACEPPGPENCTVFVDQDSWIDQGAPSVNHGSDDELVARSFITASIRPMLRYDLSSLPDGIEVGTATAWFWVTDRDASGNPVQLHRVSSPWTQTGVTWNSHGAALDQAHESVFFPTADNAWRSADLTDLVRGWLGGSSANHGITLKAISLGETSKYGSREWPELSRRPCLEIVTKCAP